MRRTLFKKLVSFVLALVMVVSGAFVGLFDLGGSKEVFAEKEPLGYVNLSIEKFTLGRGYLVEPYRVPFYEGDNGASIIARVIKENGYDLRYTGNINDTTGTVAEGFYLSYIKDDDYEEPNIPEYIMKEVDGELDGRYEDGWLGEFDYTFMSGWMYSVNNVFVNYGASMYKPKDDDVVRWQFSVWGYGADIGDNSEWGEASYLKYADKTELTRAIAYINSAENKTNMLANANVKKAYDSAYKILEDMTVTDQSVVDNAVKALNDAIEALNTVEIVFDADNGSQAVVKSVKKGQVLDYSPAAPKKAGYTFVGWYRDVDDITTAYENKATYDSDVTYKAKYAHVSMLGAQVKAIIDDKSGIRFGTRLYNDGDEIVEKGTVIIPADLIAEGEMLTLNTSKAAVSKAKAIYEKNEKENYVVYLGTLVNLPRDYFARDIAASAYVKYKDSKGNEYTVYAPYSKGSISINKLLGL